MHNLRLNYLRSVSDPYGPRILTIAQTHTQNPHILAAGLSDPDRWPELNQPISPKPTSEALPLGARLKHTQTIMGPNRTGLMGPRVDGSRRHSRLGSSQLNPSQLAPITTAAPNPPATRQKRSDSEPLPTARPNGVAASASAAAEPDENTPAAPEPALTRAQSTTRRGPITVRIPSAEEMEGRRRPRYRAHFSSPERKPADVAAVPPPVEDEGVMSGDDEDDPDDMDEDELMLEGVDDDFDEPMPSSTSDNISLMSGTSLVSGSGVARSLRESVAAARGRLSPVSEAQNHAAAAPAPPVARRQPSNGQLLQSKAPAETTPSRLQPSAPQPRVASPAPPPPPSLSFYKIQPPKAAPKRSALTALLAAQNGSDNPFTELYSLIAARSDAQGMKLAVWVLIDRTRTKLSVNVRKDATVEEVIGHALFIYWEEKKEPKLDEGLAEDAEDARTTRLTAVGWSLRIAEFDGEPDEDFPAPDRARKISGFGQSFALQVASNQQSTCYKISFVVCLPLAQSNTTQNSRRRFSAGHRALWRRRRNQRLRQRLKLRRHHHHTSKRSRHRPWRCHRPLRSARRCSITLYPVQLAASPARRSCSRCTLRTKLTI